MAKKNFTISMVATAPSPPTSGNSLVVPPGDGDKFAINEPAIIFPAGDQPLVSNAEIVTVTNVSSDTLTITRTQEGTTARAIMMGDIIIQGITMKDWNDLVTLASEASTLASGAIPKAPNVTSIDDTGIADGEIPIFDLTNKKIKTSDKTLPTGDIVGTTDPQTLTYKTLSGADNTLSDIKGTFKQMVVYTSGSGTYTVPSGVSSLIVECVGGGGGGGGGNGTAVDACGPGGGGGGGGYVMKYISSPGASYSYSIGAGGAGGYSTANGTGGGNTSFGTNFLTANGGSGGSGGINGTIAATGLYVHGGSASGGNLNIGGRDGDCWVRISGAVGFTGKGGDSRYGLGGIGCAGGYGGGSGNGTPGSGYGAGGSGGGAFNCSVHRTGGSGSNGIIIIYEYY